MWKDKWRSGGRAADSDWTDRLRFALMPLIAVLLIIVILKMDQSRVETDQGPADGTGTVMADASGGAGDMDGLNGGGAGAEEYGNAAGQAGEAPMAGDAGDAQGSDGEDVADAEEDPDLYANIDISGYELKHDEDRELTALVLTYCQAKEECDPELLAGLFDRHDLTEKELAAERERMELVKASVKGYENVTCYSIEGPVEDSYVIFPYFELKYREAEAVMPQLTWAYVTRNKDGRFVMHEDVSAAVAAYVARIGQKEDVAALRDQVAGAMAEAVASDAKLKSIYSDESEVVIGTTE